jgi:hypothetical protein
METRFSSLKQYETRGWVTPYHGVLTNHANKLIKPEYQLAAMSEPTKSLLQKEGYESWKDLPTGALLGTVELEDVFTTNFGVVKLVAIPEWKQPEKPCPDLRIITEQEFSLGDYRPGRFAWKLTNAKEISPPISISGHSHLYNIPDELLASCL